jgi:predicted RNase H-like HicB family nuclease
MQTGYTITVKSPKLGSPAKKAKKDHAHLRANAANLAIQIEKEEDGRWIAEIEQLPGVTAYGRSRADAIARVQALALRVIADRLDHGESVPNLNHIFSVSA